MSLSIGFPHPSAITIGGKSTATIDALSESTSGTSALALGKDEEGMSLKCEPVAAHLPRIKSR